MRRQAADRAAVADAAEHPGPDHAADDACRRPRWRCSCAGSGRQRVWSARSRTCVLMFGGPAPGQDPVAGRADRRRPGRGAGDLHPHRPARADRRRCGRRRARSTCSTRSGSGCSTSTITFDPLTGCERPGDRGGAGRGHDRRGQPRTPAGTGSSGTTWPGCNLAALLHAAALGELTMADVQQWVSNPRKHEPLIVSLLSESPEPAFEAAIAQFINTNDRTQSSITIDDLARPGVADPPPGPRRGAAGRQGWAPVRRRGPARRPGPRSTCSAARGPGRAAGRGVDRAHRPRGPPSWPPASPAAGWIRRCRCGWTRRR